ncbi:MAG: site-specific integrase [Candidatus Wallbacteria bacterium]|nr:site-specific integrase [Candidatus Wallbacteria bacterium]
MSWVAMQQAFLRHRQDQGMTASTLVSCRRWLDKLAAFCRAEELEEPEQITPEHLRGFHQSLLWRPGRHGRLYAANSVMQALWVVRTFLRWAHREGLLAQDPTRDLLLKRAARPPRLLLSAQDLQAVRRQLEPSTPLGLRQAAFFELLHLVPSSELLSRDLEHVEPRDRLRLSDGQALALEDRPARALTAYLQSGRPFLLRQAGERALFLGAREGTRLSSVRVQQILRALGLQAGLELQLGPRRLLQSARALADAFSRPRLPFEGPWPGPCRI